MKETIIKLEEELRLAMLSNNVEKLNELIDDSLIFITPDGQKATKQMDLEAHKAKIQKMSALNPLEQEIQLYDNLAVVNVKMNIEGTYNDISISGLYRYMRVWINKNSIWKIVSGSVVKIS